MISISGFACFYGSLVKQLLLFWLGISDQREFREQRHVLVFFFVCHFKNGNTILLHFIPCYCYRDKLLMKFMLHCQNLRQSTFHEFLFRYFYLNFYCNLNMKKWGDGGIFLMKLGDNYDFFYIKLRKKNYHLQIIQIWMYLITNWYDVCKHLHKINVHWKVW